VLDVLRAVYNGLGMLPRALTAQIRKRRACVKGFDSPEMRASRGLEAMEQLAFGRGILN